MLLHVWNMFCTFTLVLSTVCMQSPIWLFFALLWFHALPVRCTGGLNDSEMVPVAYVITSITLAFTFHIHWISIVRSLYSKNFSLPYMITFVCPGIATSINMHVPFLLHLLRCPVFLGTVLSVHTRWFHNMVTIHLWLVSIDFGTWSYQHYYYCCCWCCCCRNVYQLYVQIYLLQKY